MQIRAILAHLDALAPPHTAASWDNCGLQAGDPDAACSGVLVSVNPSAAAIARAAELGANLLVTHHPLLFKATKRLDFRTEPGSLVAALARHGITSVAAHTNLDTTACNHHLAELLGLRMDRWLQVEGRDPWYKLVTFVPPDALAAVREALWDAGAGAHGAYDRTAFWQDGTGTFRARTWAEPAEGEPGDAYRGHEARLEVLVPEAARVRSLQALLDAHPHEEPAWDLVRLENGGEAYGIGRWGEQEAPIAVEDVIRRVQTALTPRSLRLVGDRSRSVRRIGVCSGSGGDLWEVAARQGVELLITGEVRYHAALEAQARGVILLEAGHQATEEPVVKVVCRYLRDRLGSIPVHAFSEPEPFEVLS